jgi:hypothetical protein
MARLIVVLGHPGTGKSASLRNFEKDEIGYITCSGKELPFNAPFTTTTIKSLPQLTQAVQSSKKPVLVIDDFNFILEEEVQSKRNYKDKFQVFRELKENVYDLLKVISDKPGDQNIYIFGHIDTDQDRVVMRTIGNSVAKGAAPLEGMTNIVLETVVDTLEGKFLFRVRTDGSGVKSPGFGDKYMFDSDTIENDLKLVNEKINNYYKG